MSRFKRAGAYVKAHWKEFLALALAAVPAAFIIFHKGTQQAAAGALNYVPAAFGGGSGDGSGSTPTPTPTPAPTPTGTSVGGGTPTKAPPIPPTGGYAAPASLFYPTAPPSPAPAGARITGIIGSGGGANTTGRSSGTQIFGGDSALGGLAARFVRVVRPPAPAPRGRSSGTQVLP